MQLEIGEKYEPLREECELLLCKLSFENELGTKALCRSVEEKRVSGVVLARALKDFPDAFWELKLRYLVASAIREADENTTLAALNTLHKLLTESRQLKLDILHRLSSKGRPPRRHENGEPARRRLRVVNKRLDQADPVAIWLNGDRPWNELALEALHLPPQRDGSFSGLNREVGGLQRNWSRGW